MYTGRLIKKMEMTFQIPVPAACGAVWQFRRVPPAVVQSGVSAVVAHAHFRHAMGMLHDSRCKGQSAPMLVQLLEPCAIEEPPALTLLWQLQAGVLYTVRLVVRPLTRLQWTLFQENKHMIHQP